MTSDKGPMTETTDVRARRTPEGYELSMGRGKAKRTVAALRCPVNKNLFILEDSGKRGCLRELKAFWSGSPPPTPSPPPPRVEAPPVKEEPPAVKGDPLGDRVAELLEIFLHGERDGLPYQLGLMRGVKAAAATAMLAAALPSDEERKRLAALLRRHAP